RAPSMNAGEFIDFRRWAAYNLDSEVYADPNNPSFDNDEIIFDSAMDGQTSRDNVLSGWSGGAWDASRVMNTDWTDIVTQTALTTEHNLSASGGTDRMSAYASFGYLDNEGTQKGQYYERYTAKVSAEIKPTDWFTLSSSFNASWSERDFGMSRLGARSSTGPEAIYGNAKAIYNMAVP